MKIKGRAAAATVGQAVGMLGVLTGARVLTSVASPDTVGKYNLIIGISALVEGVVVRPYSQFAMRAYHDSVHEQDRANFLNQSRTLLSRYVMVACILSLLFQMASSHWASPVPTVAILISVLYTLGSACVSFETSILTTEGRIVSASAISAAQRWLVPLFGAAFILLIADTSAALISSSSVVLLLLAGVATFMVPHAGGPSVERGEQGHPTHLLSGVGRFALPLAAVGIFSWVNSVGDRYILAKYADADAVGVYSMTYGLIAAPMVASWAAAAQVLYPIVFRRAAQGGSQVRLFIAIQGGILLFTVTAALGVHFLGAQISHLLLGARFRSGGIPVMLPVCLAHGLLMMGMACDLLTLAHKKTSQMMLAYALAAAVNTGLNLYLIPRFGMVGAAWATCVSYGLYSIVMLVFSMLNLSNPPPCVSPLRPEV